MSQKTISPFRNESDVVQINGFTVENRLDRVSMYGSIDLTLDKSGLEKALTLFEIVKNTVEALKARDLPENITISKPETTKNPF